MSDVQRFSYPKLDLNEFEKEHERSGKCCISSVNEIKSNFVHIIVEDRFVHDLTIASCNMLFICV